MCVGEEIGRTEGGSPTICFLKPLLQVPGLNVKELMDGTSRHLPEQHYSFMDASP